MVRYKRNSFMTVLFVPFQIVFIKAIATNLVKSGPTDVIRHAYVLSTLKDNTGVNKKGNLYLFISARDSVRVQCMSLCQRGWVRSGLNKPFPKQALLFTGVQYKSFENTVGIGEIARNKQFLLYPKSFLPVWRTFSQFHQIQNCRLQTLSILPFSQ